MKKLFTLFFAASSIAASAQITINQADVAVIGKTVILAYENGTATVQPGPSGANKTWNFSSVTSNDQDTLTFSNTAGTPHAAHFPNANIYIPNLGIYMVKNSTGVYLDGGTDPSSGMGLLVDFNPNEQIISFPNTYLSTFANTSGFTYSDSTTQFPLPGVDSIRYKTTKFKTATTDAWGNITTPAGTFASIRVRSVEVTKDSLFLHAPFVGWTYFQDQNDTNVHFAWFASGRYFPVFEMDSSSNGIDGIDYLKIDPLSVKEENTLNANVFPNPATDFIHFNTAANGNVSLKVYDVKGAEIRSINSTTGKLDLPVANMINGVYFYIINDEKGNTAKGEFNVLH